MENNIKKYVYMYNIYAQVGQNKRQHQLGRTEGRTESQIYTKYLCCLLNKRARDEEKKLLFSSVHIIQRRSRRRRKIIHYEVIFYVSLCFSCENNTFLVLVARCNRTYSCFFYLCIARPIYI